MYVWVLVIRLMWPDLTSDEFGIPVDSKIQCLNRANAALEKYEPYDFGAVSIEVGCRKEPESRWS